MSTAAAGGDVEAPGGSLTQSLAEVTRSAREDPGFRLFTVLAWDDERGALHRVHSSAPDAYPLGGEKVMPAEAPWIVQVVRERRPYLGRDAAAVAAVFSDHALITSLGCGAVVNVPVVDGDRTLGVLNLLDEQGAYDEASVEAALGLGVRSVPALRSWHATRRPAIRGRATRRTATHPAGPGATATGTGR